MRADHVIGAAGNADRALLSDEQQGHAIGLLGELALAVATMEQARQLLEAGAVSDCGERDRVQVCR